MIAGAARCARAARSSGAAAAAEARHLVAVGSDRRPRRVARRALARPARRPAAPRRPRHRDRVRRRSRGEAARANRRYADARAGERRCRRPRADDRDPRRLSRSRRQAPRAEELAEIVFAGGGSGTLAPSSAVIEPELVVAVDVSETGARGQASRVQIRRASAVDATWLLDLYIDRIAEVDELVWNADARARRARRPDDLRRPRDRRARATSRAPARRPGAPPQLLAKQAIAAGIERFVDRDALAQWRARIAFVAGARTRVRARRADRRRARRRGRARVRGRDLVRRAAQGRPARPARRAARRQARRSSSGSRRRISRCRPPARRRSTTSSTSRRGSRRACRTSSGSRVLRRSATAASPLVLHLLAPNQRPVQVTTDLPGLLGQALPRAAQAADAALPAPPVARGSGELYRI